MTAPSDLTWARKALIAHHGKGSVAHDAVLKEQLTAWAEAGESITEKTSGCEGNCKPSQAGGRKDGDGLAGDSSSVSHTDRRIA